MSHSRAFTESVTVKASLTLALAVTGISCTGGLNLQTAVGAEW